MVARVEEHSVSMLDVAVNDQLESEGTAHILLWRSTTCVICKCGPSKLGL
jgi:hypothetical protein